MGRICFLCPAAPGKLAWSLSSVAVPAQPQKKPSKKSKAKVKKQPWPKTLSEQAAAVQTALVAIGVPADEVDVAKRFTRASKDRIAELLETLASLGSARQLADGKFLAV